MIRASALRNRVVVLGILTILTLWPAVANASGYEWFDFCECWIWVP
jgi:hypothetical protein